MAKWQCYRCGYVFEGERTPEECPSCQYSLTFWIEAAETKPPTVRSFVKTDPLTIDANESVLSAAQKMRDKGAGNILVLVNGEPKGIMTERDILNRVAADDLVASAVPVRKIMTSPMVSIEADEPLSEGIKLMAKRKIRTLFVTDHGKPFGLLNMRSVVGDQFKVAKNLDP
ncbi:MAG: CBS domain-containing protein [Nitrososphaerota archaeon]|jgi:signal-transduction protein with cAMP-binding, CBS, and nucleotidyltransferase domain|nr:CBS domain-containing protein [Nitrososphaerota archaeon]MDG6942916.1 CBS domain-containing protein [Nitrososphaerota archaeon]